MFLLDIVKQRCLSHTPMPSSLLLVIYATRCCQHEFFKFDAESEQAVNYVLKSIFCAALRQQRHRLKTTYFSGRDPCNIPRTSPVEHMTDNQWNDLVSHWFGEKNAVWLVKIVK